MNSSNGIVGSEALHMSRHPWTTTLPNVDGRGTTDRGNLKHMDQDL